ncbi:4-hydroxyphenylacetate 3-hydroxylase N-terminal domain-containing protein, partial [Klebsiella pneumoniae]|uniref:4-hydroxyphenylacetate 3-hydroxylase N-terminal domain-containing protein n=1 Tax=Klebsiella pneumoniae TaxID=573 RepID=UPI00286AED3A
MGNKSVSLPTGNDFLAGLNDGREIWAYGEKVDNVITHPAFRNSALSIGGVTHPFFRVPHSVDDLIRDRDAIAQWARLSYGWLGRSPDFKASFLTTLGANPEAYGEYADNARHWYKRSQEELLYWNHAIINPPIDRNLPPDQIEDICIH